MDGGTPSSVDRDALLLQREVTKRENLFSIITSVVNKLAESAQKVANDIAR